jgi:hypothetical protein
MTDTRITKLAQVMVHYSLALKPDQKVYIQTSPLAHEFNLAFYAEALKARTSPLPLTAFFIRGRRSSSSNTPTPSSSNPFRRCVN